MDKRNYGLIDYVLPAPFTHLPEQGLPFLAPGSYPIGFSLSILPA